MLGGLGLTRENALVFVAVILVWMLHDKKRLACTVARLARREHA